MPWRPYVPGSAVAIPPLNSEPSVRPGNKKKYANKSFLDLATIYNSTREFK
jgi:hypothetical protein